MANKAATANGVRLVHLLALAVAINAAGCRADRGPGMAAAPDYPPEAELLAQVYGPAGTPPPGFLVDERAGTEGTYSVYHVKDATGSYELCSDDFSEAYAWEAADNESRQVGGLYVDSYENRRYFEFIRDLGYPDSVGNVSAPTSPGFSRVFKCSYVDRRGVDRNAGSGFAGYLRERPLTAAGVRNFVEYMWQFTFFWPRQATLLRSTTAATETGFEHTLQLALRSRGADGQCDLIEIVDWIFTVAAADGRIDKRFVEMYEFEARLVDGVPEKCAG